MLYGNPHQFWIQLGAAAFVICWSGVGTFVVMKVVGAVVPLRMTVAQMETGDMAIHGEEVGVAIPALSPEPDLGTPLPGRAVAGGAMMASSTNVPPPPSRT